MTMSEVTTRPTDDGRWFPGRRRAFAEWRAERPFAGGSLLMLAGILIAWVPAHMVFELLMIQPAVTVLGSLFAVLVFLTGVFALRLPEYADELGILGVTLSILSLFGALGGLFVGMLVGIVGGNLCYAWTGPELDDDH